MALRLRAEGLEKGDKVVFYSENRPEWIVAFWACLLNGIVVVPLDFRSSPPFLLRVSRIVQAKLILIGEEVPRLDDTGGVPVWRLAGSDLAFQHSGPNVETQDLTPITRDDVAEIIFTSGATADPKGVVITHRNVLANIVPVEREVLKHRKWGRPFFPLRFLNLLPLSHMFGQAMATFIPPMLPGTVIFMRGYNPADIAAQIKSRRVSVLVSVPKILEVLKEYVGRASQARQEGAPKRGALQGHILTRTLRRWWHYRHVHRIFGWKFWAFIVGAAPLETELEAFWGEMGFAVIQGYGLTETAPIVTLNHPFGTKRGSVGKAIAGVEMKIAPDGEILVRGDNVTTGYIGAGAEAASAFEDGWFHTGDIGELGEDGQLFIRGRKKEMIVTPEGLNVFPDDVERVLNRPARRPGSRGRRRRQERSRARGARGRVGDCDRRDRPPCERGACGSSEDPTSHRLARPGPSSHRRHRQVEAGRDRSVVDERRAGAADAAGGADILSTLVAKYAGRANLASTTTLDELGLSSLERVELMVALEDAYGTRIDENAFAEAHDLSALRTVVEGGQAGAAALEPVEFPSWNRTWPARAVRRASLPTWILPIARLFAWIRVDGRENLEAVRGPVIFAANHQSHMDTPVILAALPSALRYRVAPAMAKEFFKAHFFPAEYSRRAWFTSSLNYYLAALFFNAFPLPQREAGARQTLQYIGEVLDAASRC